MDALEAGLADSEPPDAPVLATDPPSPAADSNPQIIGSAEAESTVAIFLGAGCEGSPLSTASAEELAAPGILGRRLRGVPVETGTAAELASPGITVNVPDETSREFTVSATDAAGNTSQCSEPIAYTNSTKIIVISPGEVIVERLRNRCRDQRTGGDHPATGDPLLQSAEARRQDAGAGEGGARRGRLPGRQGDQAEAADGPEAAGAGRQILLSRRPGPRPAATSSG